MDSDALTLANMIIEYTNNQNPAGEYSEDYKVWQDKFKLFDGGWPEEDMRCLAYKIKQKEEMRLWNL